MQGKLDGQSFSKRLARGRMIKVCLIGVIIGILITIDSCFIVPKFQQIMLGKMLTWKNVIVSRDMDSVDECLKSCNAYAITTEQCKYQCTEKYAGLSK